MVFTRSAIVTGGTINLGYYAALDIARQHPDWLVVVCSRSDRERAAEKINTTLKQNNTVFMALELNDTKKVRSFTNEWISKSHPPIQALLLNAALQFPGNTTFNSDNIEATFAISHVGHALLFHLLCPHLAPNARVVVTASGVHDPLQKSGLPDATYTSAEDLAHPPPAMANRPGTGHYTNTKLANIMWVYALSKRINERIPDRGIKVNAFDPGLMPGSGLAREYKGFMRFAWFKILPRITPLLKVAFTPNIHKPSESGASLAWVATADEMPPVSGKYFEGRKEIKSSQLSYNTDNHNDLWQWTVKHCAQDEAEIAQFEAFE